jgi:hypothetical protein
VIVLDEQLLGRGLEALIAAWYPGKICIIKVLRPGTVIKDDAIPTLLAQEDSPAFVTINESDFWQIISPDPRFCVVCFAVPSRQVALIPVFLQRLFRHPRFDTKAKRAGNMVRITTSGEAQFYDTKGRTVRTLSGF